MNMPMFWAAVWIAVAMSMRMQPRKMVMRRPNLSEMYGAKGRPAIPPMF
jgi:hypothetical protein